MSDTTWKATERRVARRFGSQRSGPRGQGVPDVITGKYSIEVKTRKRLPDWLQDALDQAERNALPDTLPVVVLHEIGRRSEHDWVLMDMKTFERLNSLR